MVELIPAYGEKNLFLRLAKDCLEELREYNKEIVWDEVACLNAMWESSFIMEDRTIQGFVSSERVSFNVFPDALYVKLIYVVPEARNRGIGLEAIKELVKSWGGDVFSYILSGDFSAKAFWISVEHELGWKRIQRPEIDEKNNRELRIYQQGELL